MYSTCTCSIYSENGDNSFGKSVIWTYSAYREHVGVWRSDSVNRMLQGKGLKLASHYFTV